MSIFTHILSGRHLMDLDNRLVKGLNKQGITKMTGIQEDCFKPALEGKNIIACSGTGTGKTLAFLLPVIMKNIDNKIINIIFRVVIIGAFFMGIRTIYNFYVLMITYKGISGEDMFNRVASMVDDYVMFMVFMVASVVFSVLARKLVNNNTFIIRTISIAVSLVCSVPELIAVYYFAMLTMVKYPQYANILGVSVTLNDVYTSSAAVFLQNNPYMFYTFFVGVAVFAVLTITSIYSLITDRKTQQV